MKIRSWVFGASIAFVLVASMGGTGCREKRYTIEVERIAETPDELNYITLAELAYPPEADVLALAHEDIFHSVEEPLWWYGDFDGFRSPYCITEGTIDYYTDVIAKLRNRELFSLPIMTASFSYRATVEHQDAYQHEGFNWDTYETTLDQFTNVYVVSMHMDWSFICGRLCGGFYDKDRIVVLNPEGDVLAIYGDGKTQWGMM